MPRPETAPAAARYLALCARPTEPLVAAELRALADVRDIEIGEGLVAFSGPLAALYRANLHLRCASRILCRLADFPCYGPEDLYAAAYSLPWEDFISPDGTLAVSAHGSGPGLTNSMFTALRVKDAAADRFRARFGRRPDVNTAQPDLRINVQLYEGSDPRGGRDRSRSGPRCVLSVDSSDPPLYQRGYRQETVSAPLKETLAAAILAIALGRAGDPWAADATDPAAETVSRPLVDLCCGSGTLLTEAGLIALRRAPGRARRFGFMRWRSFDAALWQRLQKEAQRAERQIKGPFLYGVDIDRSAVLTARRNIVAAGLSGLASISVGNLRTAEPPPGPPGIVVCNPPYGERLLADRPSELGALYTALGDTLKQRFVGYTAFVYTANLDLIGPIGLRPRSRHILYNGNLEGRLLELPLY